VEIVEALSLVEIAGTATGVKAVVTLEFCDRARN
jgi:hypothetical protein